MTQKRLEIKNKLGLHARPAAQLVKIASKFKSDVFIALDDHEVNGKSIMGVMMLAAGMGSLLTITTKGVDEIEAMAALEALILAKFNED
ncbi:HPr family phosphocarrier protein [bacterium]|nr:HPr family phosphocarrier protein [bacterium]